MKIEEADDGAQKVVDGKLFVMCDCSYHDKCPNGKPPGSSRCTVRLDVNRLKRKEVARLTTPQR